MRHALTLTLPLLLAACSSPATMNRSDLMVGYHGVANHYLEVGWTLHNTPPQSSIYSFRAQGYSLSTEMRLGEDIIMGAEASAWGSIFFLEGGANMILYTDFEHASLRFRPELGFRIGDIRITGGYNLPLKGPQFGGVNSFDLGLRWSLGL